MRSAVGLLLALATALAVAWCLRARGGAQDTREAAPAADPAAPGLAASLRERVADTRVAREDPVALAPAPSPTPAEAWKPQSIRGRLVYPDGSPAAHVWIELGSVATRRSSMSFARSGWPSAETAEDGKFEIGNLDEGTYAARADVEHDGRRWRLSREVEPGPDEAAWTLEEGRLLLTVSVLDPDRVRAPSASVHLLAGGRERYAFASEGVARFFEFGEAPPARTGTLVAQLFYDEVPALWAPTVLEGVDLAKGVATIRAERGGLIAGHVEPGMDGIPPEGRVYAVAAGGGARDAFADRSSPIGPRGEFHFKALSSGPWRLYVRDGFLNIVSEQVVAEIGDLGVVVRPLPTLGVPPMDGDAKQSQESAPEAVVEGTVRDTAGTPISFVAVWGRQGKAVAKIAADEGGRFSLYGLRPGPVAIEVRLAPGWDQPETVAHAASVAAVAPARDVAVTVDLGSTIRIRFSNWPYDVDREGAALVEEGTGTVVEPASWTWSELLFARLTPAATYRLFVHATGTDLFARVAGLRPGEARTVRLEHGAAVRGRLRGIEGAGEAHVFAETLGVRFEGDVDADGRFEVRGLPADATAALTASTAGPGPMGREARGTAKAGAADVELTLVPVPSATR